MRANLPELVACGLRSGKSACMRLNGPFTLTCAPMSAKLERECLNMRFYLESFPPVYGVGIHKRLGFWQLTSVGHQNAPIPSKRSSLFD
ncbi:hypothetical protein AC579_6567 [Pseudocercospora musae]|uniref:Uncharacterized protein n=1 Tax=Pseudocercospora musae TaxID=113226 RepID=A0A139I1Q6_9PEZI|nr:hypothetical protein AC579_6567 [Pseudocercospora musae]